MTKVQFMEKYGLETTYCGINDVSTNYVLLLAMTNLSDAQYVINFMEASPSETFKAELLNRIDGVKTLLSDWGVVLKTEERILEDFLTA